MGLCSKQGNCTHALLSCVGSRMVVWKCFTPISYDFFQEPKIYSKIIKILNYWIGRGYIYYTFVWKKNTFLKKGPQKFHSLPPPIQSLFVSALHQNNFSKRGQHSIVQRNIGLQYAVRWLVILISLMIFPGIVKNTGNGSLQTLLA